MTDLPPGWEWTTLGELCDINPRQFDNPPRDDEEITLVPMAAMEAETGRIDSSKKIRYSDARRSLTPFQELDVLFAKITPCMENGKVGVARKLHSGRGIGSTEFFVLRSRGAVLPEYLAHYLIQSSVRQDAERNMTGAVGQRRVPRSYLAGLSLPIPPLAEQRRIVAALDGYLSHLEAADESLQLILRRAIRLSSSILSRAVSGDLVEGEESDDSAVNLIHQIAEERKSVGCDTKTSLPPVLEPLPAVPERWVVASLDQLAHRVQYGTSAKASTEKTAASLPVIRMGNIQDCHLVLDHLKYLPVDHPDLHDRVLKNGDLLFNRTNSAELVGKSAVYRQKNMRATFASYLIRCQFARGVTPEWVNLVINSGVGRRYVQSVASQQVGQANVSGAKLRQMPIPLPSTAEQLRIVQRVAETFDFVEHVSVQAAGALQQSQRLRKAILTDAFSGRLVSQVPNDEPASVLLERIRAERAAQPMGGRARRSPKKPDGQGSLL
ncbi:MAG: restriction endonuclease subunit S [Actinobacteria bacterium]|nr:restriction endonuclease subunit S [Actinomycetota bacterium]